MTYVIDQKREENIRHLATIVTNCKVMVECWEMANTPTDSEDRRKSYAAMSIARADLAQAQKNLDDAMKPE